VTAIRADQGWRDITMPPKGRAEALLEALSAEEKIAVALGEFDKVAHLGVPALRYTDGPNGIRGPEAVTAFPAALALAAAFDEELAAAYGAAIAEEARDTGSNVLLAPAVDIARTPLGGRLPEAMGEDPYLTGRLAATEVRAVQDEHVVSMVKHFIGNNAETCRTGYAVPGGRTDAINAVVSERALQEIYYPPFKAVVDAGVGSVMSSYNRLNGTYASQNPDIFHVLKDAWGWPGFVAPDFLHAVRDPVAAANAGLDIPGLGVPEGRTREDFTSERIPAERLDDIVRRVLVTMFSVGLFDHPPPQHPPGGLASTPEHVALATRIAVEGTVLLINRDALLPLASDSLSSIAVIGTAGQDAQWVMAGSPCVRVPPERRITPLNGITTHAGEAGRVRFAQGSYGDAALPIIPTHVLRPPDRTDTGLLAKYWNGPTPDGEPVLTVVDPTVDISRAPEGVSGDLWCARWTGTLTPERDGPHRFTVLASGIVTLQMDGTVVAAGQREFGQEFGGPALPVSGSADLRAGQPVTIQLDYNSATAWVMPDLGLGGDVRLGWQPPDSQIPDAARMAADCDVAIVFASQAQGEGMDRGSLALPGDQDALISAVAAGNPRTVVVLNTSGPVVMPWLDRVAAVLQVWHPGQQFGEAIAAVLFGDTDPCGRLPLTFPAAVDQGAITRPEQYPGVAGNALYEEGIFVGYRWYDQSREQPLFPFGHGLSYSDFHYANPQVTLDAAPESATVTVELTNTGSRNATEVAQLYVTAPAQAAEPPQQLRGFQKVRLASGASTTVTFRLTTVDLAAFDETTGQWTTQDGRYQIRIGRSSRDLRLTAAVEVRSGRLAVGSPRQAVR
jgi:beta-glucosidase